MHRGNDICANSMAGAQNQNLKKQDRSATNSSMIKNYEKCRMNNDGMIRIKLKDQSNMSRQRKKSFRFLRMRMIFLRSCAQPRLIIFKWRRIYGIDRLAMMSLARTEFIGHRS